MKSSLHIDIQLLVTECNLNQAFPIQPAIECRFDSTRIVKTTIILLHINIDILDNRLMF